VTDQSLNLLPSYTTLNSAVNVDVRRVRVTLAGTNLSNEYYIADDMSATDSGYPGPPRSVRLQLRYRF
jgi:outer membrane receptor protein involved in Fe transport